MVIIGFVVAVMIFSSFAIVFSNSGNNKNTSNKQILNIPEKSFTSNVVNKYQIDLSNLPSGNGYYQQLITLNNYDTYGINSNGSNIEFFSSNNTQLYTWIQSINSTSMQIWIKNFNQSSIMYLYVLQSYENLLSNNSYLGEAPQLSSTYAKYDNGKFVFPYYWNFSGNSLPSGWNPNGVNYNVSNGLYLSYTASYSYFLTSQILNINNEILANIEIGNGGEGRLVEDNNTLSQTENQQTIIDYEPSGWSLSGYNGTGGSNTVIPTSSGYHTYGLYVNDTDGFLNYLGTGYVAGIGYHYNSSNKFFIGLGGNNPNQYENVSYIAVSTLSMLYMPIYTINQILNLQSGISKTVTISNGKNDANSPIEFYANFMLYVNASNDLIIENLTNSQTVNTGLTYNTTYDSNYYGLIVYESYLYVYLIKAVADSGINYGICIYLHRYTIDGFTLENTYKYNAAGIEGGNEVLGLFGITANTNGIYAFIGYDNSGTCYPIFMHLSYTDTEISFKAYTNLTITDTDYSGIVMGNFYEFNTNGNNYLVNLNYLTLYSLGNSLADWYGEIIYNNTYENNFSILTTSNENNIYISNYINYGCLYNPFSKTSNPEPQIYNNRREANTNNAEVSFINENFYNNAYVNSNDTFIFNKTDKLKLGSYTLPYTISNKKIYYSINSYTYGITNITNYLYNINIKSYNHNSNQIKDYFFYNNNIYYGNEFNFTNPNGIYSLLPLNYSIYTYNNSYIITTSSDFKSIGNEIYQYNLTIYYNQLSTNSQLPKNPIAFGSYTELLTYLFIFFAVISLVFMTKKYGFDNNSKRGKK